MTALLELKERLRIFYSKYDIYLIPLWKFIFAMFSFMMLNSQIGFMEKLTSPLISLLLSLICSFLPVNMIAVFAALLLCAHAFALALEIFAITVGLLFIMYAIYFRVAPNYGYLLVLTPLAFYFQIPYALPLILGLVGTPVSAIPIAFGTIVYYLMYFMKTNEMMLSSTEAEEMISRILYLVENVLLNKMALLAILVFTCTLLFVYMLRRLSVDYAWYIAIGSGAALNVLLFLLGTLILKVNTSIIAVIFGTIISIGLALVVEFFVFGVDYSRTEYAQFEDDEYYYYVKAVPKMSIAIPEKTVKKINTNNRTTKKRSVERHER